MIPRILCVGAATFDTIFRVPAIPSPPTKVLPTTCLQQAGGMAASATFKNQYTLSIGRSNPGTVTGTPAGNDRAIDCGGNCSAKFTDGTVVTLTAVPPAGKTFANWSGACAAAGTATTCTLPISGNLSVQAVFNK